MCPAAHSSGSRTSTRTAPFESWSRAAAGSTSAILVLIWRRSSTPDGIGKLLKAVGIQYFSQYSSAYHPRHLSRSRPGAVAGRLFRRRPARPDPIGLPLVAAPVLVQA